METHILFFILAGLLIAILVGYSLWSARREKSRVFSNTFSTRPVSNPVGSHNPTELPESLNPEGFKPQVTAETESPEQWQAHQQEIDSQVREINIKLPNQPEHTPVQQQPIFSATPIQQAQPQPEIVIEPEIQSIATQEHEITSAVETEQHEQAVDNSIITLFVVAPQGGHFNGLAVVQQLESLGLQYGEYHIFHRYIDNVDSPVLFSVANMMQPGVFEMHNIEQFATIGLVFFMQLPSPTNDLANLRIMINTAESLAKSLGGFVLDENQQLFDDNTRQQYLLRVKNS